MNECNKYEYCVPFPWGRARDGLYSFDAYGRRRSADDWSYTLDTNDKSLFADRGYTGHEHLDQFKLINMNGRLYDPVVGRFLSPDNYVQSPSTTQSFNRYGYCLNNPLRYTDPSGEILWPLFLFFTDPGYNLQKFLYPFAFHIDIKWSNEKKSLGFDYSYGVPQIIPGSYRKHGGNYYYWKDYDNSYSGWEKRSGSEWSALNGLISYSCTFYDREGTKFDQYRDNIKLGIPFDYLEFENDLDMNFLNLPWMPNHISSDKFLTGQVKMRFGMAELGLTLFTGDPGPNMASRNFDPETGDYLKGMNGEDPDEFRAGILYVGFGPIKLGINSEDIRDHTQNWLHRNITHDPTFKKLPRRPRFFWEIF